jgi:copper chaperone CopZ
LRYCFDVLLGGIARPLLVGTVVGGAIAYFLPAGVLEQYVGPGPLQYLAMLVVGIPLYVCASGSIPLAAALMLKGISPGAALVFLIAGPATNAATVTVVSGMLGKRTLLIYLAFLMAGSLAVGFGADALFARFPSLAPDLAAGAGHVHEDLGWLEIGSGVAIGLIALFHAARPLVRRLRGVPAPPEEGGLVLEVPDMSCQHCAATITRAVDGIPGVRDIDADPASKRVVLGVDQQVDRAAVLAAISAAGFHPRATEPDTPTT